jgi:predicted N-acyltransferase
VLARQGRRLVGALPAWLKTDSYGEYIFDWGWAQAALRAGIPYYPKLVVGVPFTPATGPRILAADDAARAALLSGLRDLRAELGASSIHVLFPLESEAAWLESEGFARRTTHQFHWRNPGYGSFDDFLSALRSEPRKQIKKERRKVQEAGLLIERVRGDRLSDEDWRKLFVIYRSTTDRKWGRPYLNEGFFTGAKAAIGARALVAVARKKGKMVAASLSFERGPNVYGRYWGALEPVEGLHFELCYYQLIEHAIAERCVLVEAGAQGEHKMKRGFLPVAIHSAHLIAHPKLDQAIRRALAIERAEVETELRTAEDAGPFRADARPPFPRVAGVPLLLDAVRPATMPGP